MRTLPKRSRPLRGRGSLFLKRGRGGACYTCGETEMDGPIVFVGPPGASRIPTVFLD